MFGGYGQTEIKSGLDRGSFGGMMLTVVCYLVLAGAALFPAKEQIHRLEILLDI